VFNNNRLQGGQIWGGTIPTNATWKVWNTNVPYVITADVSLPENNTLTVDPGATIKFQGAGLFIYGTLRAEGVAGRISFTSWRDDTLAGDSNGDGASAVAAPGDWKGIYLSPNSGNTVLNNCLLRYAGMGNLAFLHGAYRYVTVFID